MSDNLAPVADNDPYLQSLDAGIGSLDGGGGPINAHDALDEIDPSDVDFDSDPLADTGTEDQTRHALPDRVLDEVVSGLAAAEPLPFLGVLVGALGRISSTAFGHNSSIEIVRRTLGHGIAQGLDEREVFETLVGALIRKGFRSEALRGAVPIVAAFLARIASEPIRAARSEPAKRADLTALVQAAVQIVGDLLVSRGPRGWRLLPNTAAAAAHRAAQQRLTIGDLAEALPRFAAANKKSQHHDLASSVQDPEEPMKRRRIVLSGPVEIVILGR